MTFERFNRPHTPTEEAQVFIYTTYNLLFETKWLSPRTKQTTLETAAVNLYPWKIVCISEEALRSILCTNSTVGLRRGHPTKRADRAHKLFNRDKPMGMRELSDYYFRLDTVALVLSAENNKHGDAHWSNLYEVPEGRLINGSFSVRLGQGDIEWVRNLCQEKNICADKS